ncbi:hypothetical protein [Pontibacillus litoralis]|uniref:DUF1878 domain-containing protein n=1 Tax=Pontibacillus litoralis JSM 072002 TaxID=1385512 RepID=A0A0A5HQH1_9BACI|nr:hypothetical protein [Pontibacillus litoralis]KGX85872.1 hypothetical protein N784_06680 [Pontibacillus litoralis JSM 072002]
MDSREQITRLENEVRELKTTLEELEFRQDLIFHDSPVNRIIYEYKVTKQQYDKVMDLMDQYREKIENNEKVSHGVFEQKIYDLIPQQSGNYHFVEFLAAAFKEENRWEEVFLTLYSDMPKFKNLKERG